jgi:hypothetical protein
VRGAINNFLVHGFFLEALGINRTFKFLGLNYICSFEILRASRIVFFNVLSLNNRK